MGKQKAPRRDHVLKALDDKARLFRASRERMTARREDLVAEVAVAFAAGATDEEVTSVLVLAGVELDRIDLRPLADQ